MALFRKPPPEAKGPPGDLHADFRELLYADQPLERWTAVDPDLARAAALTTAGDFHQAAAVLRPIADDLSRESRVRLVAWNALRGLGVSPEPEIAAAVLGVVLEVPMHGGRDTLAVYPDGRVRYVNYSGAATVVEPQGINGPEPIVAELIDRAQAVADAIGPWDGPRPPLPAGVCRVSMLCPGGLYFGQGDLAALAADDRAGRVLAIGAQLVGALPLSNKAQ